MNTLLHSISYEEVFNHFSRVNNFICEMTFAKAIDKSKDLWKVAIFFSVSNHNQNFGSKMKVGHFW